jgi:dihydroorotate dehydrogenase
VGDARLSVGVGGLSGTALWDRTPSILEDVRATTGHSIPINACGGVSTWQDVLTCLDAGATTVQIYSALIFQGPAVVGALCRGLARTLRERRTTVGDFAGSAEPAA